MTHTEMHWALWEFMGWHVCHKCPCGFWFPPDDPECNNLVGAIQKIELSDLTLDWLSEVEAKLTTDEQQNRYQAEIAEICWADHERANNQVVFNQLTATKHQRLEALCRTLGLIQKEESNA